MKILKKKNLKKKEKKLSGMNDGSRNFFSLLPK
jgi:hypothetical protein